MAEFDFAANLMCRVGINLDFNLVWATIALAVPVGCCNRRFVLRKRVVPNVRIGSQKIVEASHGSGAALKNVGDKPNRNHREYQLDQEPVKGHKRSEGYLVVRNFHATQAKQYDYGQANQRGKRREEKAP